jgi:hypothetical protein
MLLLGESSIMKLKHLLVFTAIVLVFLTGCSKDQVAVTVSPGETFTIGVGQSARITGEDMIVKFVEVIGDSRCPQNVNCVWEGVASSRVAVTHKDVSYQIVLNQPGHTEYAEETFIDYMLTYSLNPYPREGEEISPDEYRLTLIITK